MRWILCVIFTYSTLIGKAQAEYEFGILPEIAVTYKKNAWRFSGQLESMQRTYHIKDEISSGSYEYIRTDLTGIASLKAGPHLSVGIGLLNRWTSAGITRRLIQQASFVFRRPAIRLGHRFRTDQTFTEGESMRFRLRYRLSIELPLQGQDLNNKEWYLKGASELLSQLQNDDLTAEYRFSPVLGYFFSKTHKVESGIEYRHGKIFSSTHVLQGWWTLNYYLNL